MCLRENYSKNANQLSSVYMMGTVFASGLNESDDCLKSVISEMNLIYGSDIGRIYLECTYQAGIYLFKLKMKTPDQCMKSVQR